MSAIYYVIDPNGDVYSEDRRVRYSVLKGEEAYNFLMSKRGKKMHFAKVAGERDNSISLEIPNERVSEFRSAKNRSDYVKQIESEHMVLSLDAPVGEDEFETLESQIADPDADVEGEVIRGEEAAIVRKAMSYLNPKEYEVIIRLYFNQEKLTEYEVALIMGISQQLVSYYRKVAEKKLKKFLENVL